MEDLVRINLDGNDKNSFVPTVEFWENKRVFLTGHTGFKGTWLTIWLSSLGAKVRGFALEPNTNPDMFSAIDLESHCESVIGDIRERKSLASSLNAFDPDIVIHMAAQPILRKSYHRPLETLETNVMGTANVLDSCRNLSSLKAIIIVTTDKCYENKEWLWAYREDEPLGGHDPYSSSKACAELVSQAYRKSFFSQEGQPAVATVRAGNIIGGGDWGEDRLMPDFIRALIDQQQLTLRNPSAVRPWQHVCDPLRGYLMLARALYENGFQFATAFNFGPMGGRPYTVQTVIERANTYWGNRLGWAHYKTDCWLHEATSLKLDSTRAFHVLGWAPIFDTEQSIKAAIDWYQAYYAEASPDELFKLSLEQIQEDQ